MTSSCEQATHATKEAKAEETQAALKRAASESAAAAAEAQQQLAVERTEDQLMLTREHTDGCTEPSLPIPPICLCVCLCLSVSIYGGGQSTLSVSSLGVALAIESMLTTVRYSNDSYFNEGAKLQKSEIAVEELRGSIIKLTGDKLKLYGAIPRAFSFHEKRGGEKREQWHSKGGAVPISW